MKIHRTSKKAAFLAIPAVVVIAAATYVYFAHQNSLWPFLSTKSADTPLVVDGINYAPPTDQEKAASQDAKKDTSHSAENTGSTSSDGKNISVGVAYAAYDSAKGAVDIRAFTPDVIEGTGTCTARLTLDDITVTESSKAFVDSKSSQCEPILIQKTNFTTAGKWRLVVSYQSPTSEGSSPAMEVEVPNE